MTRTCKILTTTQNDKMKSYFGGYKGRGPPFRNVEVVRWWDYSWRILYFVRKVKYPTYGGITSFWDRLTKGMLGVLQSRWLDETSQWQRRKGKGRAVGGATDTGGDLVRGSHETHM